MSNKKTAASKTAAKKPSAKKVAVAKTVPTTPVTPDETKTDLGSGSSPETGSSPVQSGSSPETNSSPDQTGSSPCNGNCGSNHCDTNGCNERERVLVYSESHSLPSAMAYAIASHQPCIVIPYKKSSAAGNELLYALRAWDLNLPDCKVVIIGDREDWFSDEVEHIEAEILSTNPQIDVAFKMLLAIADERIPENFIWSNDDIYPVTPLHTADLELLTCNGPLPSAASKPGVNGIYAKNKQQTVDFLKHYGLPTWDYSTHTPFIFNKEKLAGVISGARADEHGFLISSLYFNSHFPEVVPVKVTGDANCVYYAMIHRDNAPADVIEKVFNTRKFVNLNDKGYKAALPVLQRKFSDKSRFEL